MPDDRLKFDIHVDGEPPMRERWLAADRMDRSFPAQVTPSVIRWARRTALMSQKRAAAELGVTVNVIRVWERGEGKPFLNEVRAMGELYQRPWALFLLPSPPRGIMHWQPFRAWKRKLMMRLVPICRNIVDEWGDEQ